MSPVGALNNGIELLADETDPDMREKCLELLADSARASANKLKFFRLAFGAAGGFGEEIDTHEAEVALQGLFGAERRIELGWVVGDEKLPKDAVKLLLNLALLAGDALVRGGRLDVGAEVQRWADRAGGSRRRTPYPARPGTARDAREGRQWPDRGARRWCLAGAQPRRRCGRVGPAVAARQRRADDRRAPAATIRRRSIGTGITAR